MSTRPISVLVASSLLALLSSCAAIDRMTGMDQAKDLSRNGEPARARVLEIWDTNMTLNDDPVVGMRLEVRPATGEPYVAETRSVVPRLQVCQVQPGADVAVRVDPANPARVSLEYR